MQKKSIRKHWVKFFVRTRPTDPWYHILQTSEKSRKYTGIILSDEHSLIGFCKNFTELLFFELLLKFEHKLGINLDSELKFEDHVNFICKKASQKLYAFAQIAPFMDLKQRRHVMKAFVDLKLDIVLYYGCFTVEDLIIK